MQVVEVDPRDDVAFAAWFGVLEASIEHGRPKEPHWLPGEQREIALRRLAPDAVETGPLLLALHGALPVGCARLTLPQRDNLELAACVIEVHPEHRRRGVGSMLLAELVRRAAGRSALTIEVDEPPGGSPAPAFLARHGFVIGLRESRRALDLPVRLSALQSPQPEGYELVTWRDRTPEHLLADRARLAQAMSIEVPWGEVPHDEEVWDAERVRMGETGLLAQDRTWWTAAAARDGLLVAFTDLGVPRSAPQRAYQWSTLVLPDHRGHGLGRWLKVTALRQLQEASPATHILSTWNADSNAPMVGVNDALGFRRNGTLSIWTLDLSQTGSRPTRPIHLVD